jgi:hypothetical protein
MEAYRDISTTGRHLTSSDALQSVQALAANASICLGPPLSAFFPYGYFSFILLDMRSFFYRIRIHTRYSRNLRKTHGS